MLRPDQQQWAVEHSEIMQSIAKTEIQVAALRRFAALTPETVAAVKYEASAMGRVAYEALEGNAARIADVLQRAVDRAKRGAKAPHWQVIRKVHNRLNQVVAQEPLRNACHWLNFHLWCAEVQRQYKETMMRLQRMENVSGFCSDWNRIHHCSDPLVARSRHYAGTCGTPVVSICEVGLSGW